MSKAIQYSARFLMHHTKSHEETSQRFRALFVNMKDARKLFRLFKGINEIQKVKNLLVKTPVGMDELDLLLALATRISFFGYWLFDNLVILSKVKMINKKPKDFLKPAMFCWWLANTFNILAAIKKLRVIRRELRAKVNLVKKDPSKEEAFGDRIKALKKQRNAKIRAIFKSCGDFVTSANGWGLVNKLGLKVNDGQIGVCGLVSSLIACYEAAPAKK